MRDRAARPSSFRRESPGTLRLTPRLPARASIRSPNDFRGDSLCDETVHFRGILRVIFVTRQSGDV